MFILISFLYDLFLIIYSYKKKWSSIIFHTAICVFDSIFTSAVKLKGAQMRDAKSHINYGEAAQTGDQRPQCQPNG
jgi:hypothetical protein